MAATPYDAMIEGGLGAAGMAAGLLQEGGRLRTAGRSYDNGIRDLQGTDVEANDAWRGYEEDPYARRAQVGALAGLQDVYAQRGMDAGSRATMQQGFRGAAEQDRMQQGAITSEMQQRGGLTGGNALQSRLSAGQQGSNGAWGAATQATGDARQRALGAMTGAGQVGAQLRHGDLASQSARRNAGNTIGMFNAQQRLGRSQSVATMHAGRGDLYANAAGRSVRQGAGMGRAAGAFAGGFGS